MKIENNYMIKPFTALRFDRPWGYYGLYSDNEQCTCKVLYVYKNEMLSMQYHFQRDQFYLVMDDGFTIEYSKIPIPQYIIDDTDEEKRFRNTEDFLKENLVTVEASEGDMFGFRRLVVHRAFYKGNKDIGRILDIAFGYNDEEDIIRIKDKYNRK